MNEVVFYVTHVANHSRLQAIATLGIGAFMLLLGCALDILSHFQALDYLQSHWSTAFEFLNSAKTHTVLILVGLGMIGFAILKLNQNQPAPEQSVSSSPPVPPQPLMSQEQEMSNSGNATMANSGNAKIEQHFHGYPPIPPASPVPLEEEELPVLEFVDAKEIFLGFSQGVAVEIPAGTHIGLAAKFKNRAQGEQSKNVDAEGVTGNVEYRNAFGDQEHVACCWIEHRFQGIEIKPGRSQRLVVAFRDKPNAKVQALACENEGAMPITIGRFAYMKVLQSLRWPSQKDIVQDCNELEIVLIGNDGHTLFTGRFGLVLADGKMSLRKM